jgi:hypothetical protein
LVYYKSKIKLQVPAHWAHDEGKLNAKGKLFTPVPSSQALTKEMWEVETPTVCKEIKTKCQELHNACNIEQIYLGTYTILYMNVAYVIAWPQGF